MNFVSNQSSEKILITNNQPSRKIKTSDEDSKEKTNSK